MKESTVLTSLTRSWTLSTNSRAEIQRNELAGPWGLLKLISGELMHLAFMDVACFYICKNRKYYKEMPISQALFCPGNPNLVGTAFASHSLLGGVRALCTTIMSISNTYLQGGQLDFRFISKQLNIMFVNITFFSPVSKAKQRTFQPSALSRSVILLDTFISFPNLGTEVSFLSLHLFDSNCIFSHSLQLVASPHFGKFLVIRNLSDFLGIFSSAKSTIKLKTRSPSKTNL